MHHKSLVEMLDELSCKMHAAIIKRHERKEYPLHYVHTQDFALRCCVENAIAISHKTNPTEEECNTLQRAIDHLNRVKSGHPIIEGV